MWMPLWIGDYLRDTLGLDRAEHGSYLLFIMAYWANGGPIKDDDRLVKNIVRCPDHEWSRTRGWLLDYFTIENGYWRHKRIDAELKAAKDRAEAQRRRTQAATEARLGNVTSDVTSNVTKDVTSHVTFTSSPSPSPSYTQPQSHTPSGGVGECVSDKLKREKAQFERQTRFESLQAEVCKLYNRPVRVFGVSSEEHHLLADLARRPSAESELREIRAYHNRLPVKDRKFFPQSAVRLLQTWDSVLDRARNYTPDPSVRSLADKQHDRAIREAMQ